MEEQFVPYELALKLKELGFNEMCIATFDEDNNFELQDFQQSYDTFPKHIISAPLWQQAFDWFRENHSLYSIIIPTINMYWTFKTTTVVESMVEVPPYAHVDANDYSTYEEARQACLEKLIELCKSH